jgi:hypothetical protein
MGKGGHTTGARTSTILLAWPSDLKPLSHTLTLKSIDIRLSARQFGKGMLVYVA